MSTFLGWPSRSALGWPKRSALGWRDKRGAQFASVWKLKGLDGSILWTFDTGGDAWCAAIDGSNPDHLWVGGARTSASWFGGPASFATLWKLDKDGNLLAVYDTGGTAVYAVATDATGNIYIVLGNGTLSSVRKINGATLTQAWAIAAGSTIFSGTGFLNPGIVVTATGLVWAGGIVSGVQVFAAFDQATGSMVAYWSRGIGLAWWPAVLGPDGNVYVPEIGLGGLGKNAMEFAATPQYNPFAPFLALTGWTLFSAGASSNQPQSLAIGAGGVAYYGFNSSVTGAGITSGKQPVQAFLLTHGPYPPPFSNATGALVWASEAVPANWLAVTSDSAVLATGRETVFAQNLDQTTKINSTTGATIWKNSVPGHCAAAANDASIYVAGFRIKL